jgi:hypothetical protein
VAALDAVTDALESSLARKRRHGRAVST